VTALKNARGSSGAVTASYLTRRRPNDHIRWRDERYAGTATGKLDVIVPPHSVKLLRVAPVRAHPWELSTDIHIRPGQAELTKIAWDEAVRSLRLRPTRDGKVFLRAPKEFRVTEPADLWVAKDGNDASLNVRVPLGPEERVVRFVPL
jgi:hypothetical protein